MDPHANQPVVAAGVALGQSPIAVIMVHGRHAAPRNILDLVPRIARDACTYLAPAAAGNTWYPHSFMAEVSTNEPGLSSGLARLARLVDDVVGRGVRRDRLVLLGFSQGACLTAEFAVRHPQRYGGVVVLSGGLIGPPGTRWNESGSFAGTPVFLGCSDVDAHVPKERVHESAEVFGRMGAAVTRRLYPGMGHLVNDDEIAECRRILDRLGLKAEAECRSEP